MTTIDIPAHVAVIAVGGRSAPLAELLDRVPAPATPWNVDRPDEAAEALHAALSTHSRARIAMRRAHPKAVRDIASIAKRHGAVTVVLALPGAPDLGDATDKTTLIEIDDIDKVDFRIVPMPSDLSHIEGPFDIFGDIHGAADELEEMMTRLGHMVDGKVVRHAQGRIPTFLGDYTDRGPRNADSLEIVRAATKVGGLAILGNHDKKLMRALMGRDVRLAAGIQMTLAEIATKSEDWRAGMVAWLETLQTHLVLDRGRLVIAHAGLGEEHHGRHSAGAESAALYGRAGGDGKVLDENGYPVAADWAKDYRGKAAVVQGHVVHPAPRILNNSYSIDTGVVFGGALTVMHWPERTFTQVKAHRTWFTPHGRAVAAGSEGPP